MRTPARHEPSRGVAVKENIIGYVERTRAFFVIPKTYAIYEGWHGRQNNETVPGGTRGND